MVVKKISELTEEEIKRELTKRGLETSGDKAELFARLKKILVDEAIKKKAQQAAANGTSSTTIADVKPVETVPTSSLSKQPQNMFSPRIEEKNITNVVKVVEDSLMNPDISKSEHSNINSSSKLDGEGKIDHSQLQEVSQNANIVVTNPVITQNLENPKLIKVTATNNLIVNQAPKSNIPSNTPKVEAKTVTTQIQSVSKVTTAVANKLDSVRIGTPIGKTLLNTSNSKIGTMLDNQSLPKSNPDISRPSVEKTTIIVSNKSPIKSGGGDGAATSIVSNKPVVKTAMVQIPKQTTLPKLDSGEKGKSISEGIVETMNPISNDQNKIVDAQMIVRETTATKPNIVSPIKNANPSQIIVAAKLKTGSLAQPENKTDPKIAIPIKINNVACAKNDANVKSNNTINDNNKSAILAKNIDKSNVNIVPVTKGIIDNNAKILVKALNKVEGIKSTVEKPVVLVKNTISEFTMEHSICNDSFSTPILEINAGFETSIEEDYTQKNDLNAANTHLTNIKSATEALDVKNKDLKDEPLKDKEEKKCLWITGLPKSIKAQDLRSKLSEHGKIISAKIVTSAKDPGLKCFGYVLCEDEMNAQKIIDALNNKEILGSIVTVKFDSNRKLSFGTQIVTKIVGDKPKVESSSSLTNNIPAKTEIGANEAVKVNEGEVKKVPVKNIIPPAHSFWILGFSPTTKAADLKQLYLKYGKVISAKVILTSPSTPNTKYYGLITMTTEEEVNKCVKETNGILIKGFRITIKKHPVKMSVVDFLSSMKTQKEEDVKKTILKPDTATTTQSQSRGGFRGTSRYLNSNRGRGQYNSSGLKRGSIGMNRGGSRGGSIMVRRGRGGPLIPRLNTTVIPRLMKSFNQSNFDQMDHNGILGGGMGFLQAAHDNLIEERRRQEQSILKYQREQLELEKLKLERERVESERVRVQMLREREEWRMQESGSFKRPINDAAFYEHPSKRRANVSDQGFYESNSGRFESYERNVPVGINYNNRVQTPSWIINKNKATRGRGRLSNRW